MHFKNGLASDLISMYELVYCSWVIVVATVATKGLTMSTRLGEDWNRISILHSNRLRDFTIRSRTKDEQTQNYLKTNFSVSSIFSHITKNFLLLYKIIKSTQCSILVRNSWTMQIAVDSCLGENSSGNLHSFARLVCYFVLKPLNCSNGILHHSNSKSCQFTS